MEYWLYGFKTFICHHYLRLSWLLRSYSVSTPFRPYQEFLSSPNFIKGRLGNGASFYYPQATCLRIYPARHIRNLNVSAYNIFLVFKSKSTKCIFISFTCYRYVCFWITLKSSSNRIHTRFDFCEQCQIILFPPYQSNRLVLHTREVIHSKRFMVHDNI